VVRPSKSNSRHLIRRACFNLPKLSTVTTAQSSSSSVNPVHQPGSPTSQSTTSTHYHTSIDTSLSLPLTNRKTNVHDHLGFDSSQSKESPSRGVSPRINRNTPTSSVYNPSSIERL
jgi:hypothetical protein